MSGKPLSKLAVLVTAVCLAAASAGCGSNPPCDTDISAVDSARSSAKAAEAKIDSAKNQKGDLMNQIDSEKSRQENLEQQKDELLAKIRDMQG